MKSAPNMNGLVRFSHTTNLCVNEYFLPILKFTFTSPILINPKYGYHINATVTNLTYDGTPSQTCMYGGLLAVEQFENNYTESSIICKSVSGNTRSFYSQNSSLIILSYWYSQYSSVNASLRISQTKCKLLQIDHCKFDSLCQSHLNVSKCNMYLNQITHLSNVSFSFKKTMSDRWNDKLIFAMPDGTCFTLQLIRNHTYKSIKIKSSQHCSFAFTPDIISRKGREVQFQLMGTLKPYFLSKSYLALYKNYRTAVLDHKADITFYGSVDFHYFEIDQPKTMPGYIMQYLDRDRDLFVSIKSKTPTFYDVLNFLIFLPVTHRVG